MMGRSYGNRLTYRNAIGNTRTLAAKAHGGGTLPLATDMHASIKGLGNWQCNRMKGARARSPPSSLAIDPDRSSSSILLLIKTGQNRAVKHSPGHTLLCLLCLCVRNCPPSSSFSPRRFDLDMGWCGRANGPIRRQQGPAPCKTRRLRIDPASLTMQPPPTHQKSHSAYDRPSL